MERRKKAKLLNIKELETTHTTMGRILYAEEVVNLALFRASDESSGVTGQAINVSVGSVKHQINWLKTNRPM
ncbi:SDR family oxidoreductase [Desulfosarcina widdelii]|uniref:SDR family oxidoreductase n=1 Tax=Desulfosarcina widdelii TaxID=947919 RepID=UPI0012D338F3